MEGISATAYKRLRNYFKRRGYQRLDRNRNGSDSAEPRPRRWRVKVGRRLRILRRVGSPKKWLTRLRDAYVKMMLNLSNNSSLVGSGFGGPVDCGFGFGRGPLKDYDEKVVVQIHKSLVMGQAQGGIVPRAAPDHVASPSPHVNVSAG